jgi:coiled-coil domain-containing protein 12
MSDNDRKARLAALAARAGRNQSSSVTTTPGGISSDSNENNDGGINNDVVVNNNSKPALSFRNYVPKDGNLDNNKPADAAANDGNASKRQKTSSTSSSKYNDDDGDSNKPKSALELALAKTNRESREAAGHNIGEAGTWSKVTPISTKKVNWDLKRDIQQKMDKLERRTQRAIVELLRERLEKEAREGGDSDLD